MPRISIPTTARLPSSLRVDPKNPAVSKILSRLSRSSLLAVALDWLDENNLPLAQPYLRGGSDQDDYDEDDGIDDFYPPARSPESLQELYTSLQSRKGSKREILDRILEGDWRHGLSLYQLAMADLQYLYDHPTSQKWTAYRIVPLKPPTDPDGEDPPELDKQSLTIPRFHPSTFLRTLQSQTLPDIKAHYTFDTHRTLPILLLRIFILDSPYNTNLSLQHTSPAMTFDSARTVYIAFPDASPHVYISRPQQTTSTSTSTNTDTGTSAHGNSSAGGEAKSLRNLIVEGIPKALSNPLRRQRFTLRSTNLATRNLAELVERRGAGRTNSAGGGWSMYADERVKESPLDLAHRLPRPGGAVESKGERTAKRARMVARARFGGMGRVGDGKGVERVDVVIEDAFPAEAAADYDEDENEEEEGVSGLGQSTAGVGARGGGGRKSQVDVDLDRVAEDEEEGDADEVQHQDEWRPYVRLTFHGSHVFAGIRQLVECGIVDGEQMPGWMTGEEGVTIGAVRNGRIRGHKGSGL
ncbi:Kinetochore protein mis15 [Madurella mycetomatis]|uniref:Kinetochore protein mis15 n=1 Tax=Madurella mycetomatis TaxID=100816 RepID=A0A175WG62_9PEZI|nr:Kinetochore protein mis15 [Madurella mycetomatis]